MVRPRTTGASPRKTLDVVVSLKMSDWKEAKDA